ncbi:MULTISPECIES: DNA/RNA non-specific endonuclease [unclassified Pseudoclavibacter]|uniref:DNA/RNA non-specific endonuclease n=1 Tax=unclassified Pseudoclavibacter TaxID=2615177 RepID=UPI001BA7607A|nr:DNA/RNA non-specific endonuclease [Pseudoclavibacter sp. Marseille-Q4354]MBS3178915.1 DNA/RNA non-specific endonuclease [Pseudoclavibacter sp. Marseille-Q4354]
MTIEVCTGDGLIDPSAFVCKSADLDTSLIEGSATSLEGMGSGLVEKVSTISTTWTGIGASYQAPEQESVYAAITPATNAAADVETSFSSAAGYLNTYAEALEAVKPTLKDLEDRAVAFRQEALAGYNVTVWDAHGLSMEWMTTSFSDMDEKSEHIPWTEHGPAKEKNTELLAEYAAIIETVSAAATTCAAGLETLSTGSYVTEDEAITAEAIMASTELPWGYPSEEDRNCSESVAHGAGNFWHGTWTGAASLIGRDPVTGDWGWDKAGAAWGGLGNFALSTAVVLSPTTWAVKLVAPGSEADQWFDDRVNVAATGWGSLIGYDHQAALAGENGFHAWEEDAVATGTETLANIGTFFIPGANVAKGVSTAGKVGSIVTRVGGVAADFAIPGGSLAVGLVTKGIKFSPDGLKITPYVGATGVVDALSPSGGVPPVSSHFGLDAPEAPAAPSGPAGPVATPNPAAGAPAPGAASPSSAPGAPTPTSSVEGPSTNGASPSGAGSASTGQNSPGSGATGAPSSSGTSPSGTNATTGTPDGPNGVRGPEVAPTRTPEGDAEHPSGNGTQDAGGQQNAPDQQNGNGQQDAPGATPAPDANGGQVAPHAEGTPPGPAAAASYPEPPTEYPRPEPTQTVEVPKADAPGPRTPFAASSDLAPNSLYRVEGRGDFYTDADGKVVYVEANYGTTGNLNADLINPQPNATYVVHPNVGEVSEGASAAHVFETDHAGRTVGAHTEQLALGDADRSPSVQSRIGDEGGDGYDGGHLFGNGFGGGPEDANLIAMLKEINRGGGDSYFNLENSWRELLQRDPSTMIEVSIKPHYPDGSTVPDRVQVTYSVNGEMPINKEFSNVR